MDALAAVGVALLVLSVLALGAARLVDRRAHRRLAEMAELLRSGRHEELLAQGRLFGPYDRVADRLRGTSALLTGRYVRTLELLDGPATRADAVLRPVDLVGGGAALVGMGRYPEAAALLGDDPGDAPQRHLRAQVAIETGDDETAHRLLAEPHADPDDDAGRQRILGDLLIRRGRRIDGEELVRRALLVYAGSALPGSDVDAGYCHVHLAESAIAQRDADTALDRLRQAELHLRARPDNAPGFTALHLRRAEALALSGDATAATAALDAATALAATIPSPSQAAALQHTRGMVALHLGDHEGARRQLVAAKRMHEALGEGPAARAAAAALDELPGHDD